MTKISQLTDIGANLAANDEFIIRDVSDASTPNKKVTSSGFIDYVLSQGSVTGFTQIAAGAGPLARALATSSGATGTLTFSTAAATTLIERARIDSSGNVGIGTTSPEAKLTTISTATVNGVTNCTFRSSDNATSSFYIGHGSGGISNLVSDSALGFGFNSGGTYTERARIDTSGRLLVGTVTGNANGGILQLSSGITFPATAVAASDANTLDDYEEGTFTATLRGSTTDPSNPVTSTARYTKTGNVVYVQVSFDGVNTTGAAGNITITGLPITPATGHRYIGSVFSSDIATFTGTMVSTIDNNLTTIYFYAIASNAANGTVTHNAGTPRTLHVTCFYYV